MSVVLLAAMATVCVCTTALSCVLILRIRGLLQDVRRVDARAREAARSDALTRLPNRVALEERLPEILAVASERVESVAVLFVDVDRFKAINDTLGHRAGDQLLRAVAARFSKQLYGSYSVFRNGGDEFVVVIEHIRHKRAIAAAAMEVLTIFREPFKVDGRELCVTASVGTSVFPKNAQTAHDLMAYADSAMYRAKETGGNRTPSFMMAACMRARWRGWPWNKICATPWGATSLRSRINR